MKKAYLVNTNTEKNLKEIIAELDKAIKGGKIILRRMIRMKTLKNSRYGNIG